MGRLSRKSSPGSKTASELKVADPPSTLTPTSVPPAGACVPAGRSALTHTVLVRELSSRLVTGSPSEFTQERMTPVSTICNVSSSVTSVPSTVAAPVNVTSSALSVVLSSLAVSWKLAEPSVCSPGMLIVNMLPVRSV